MKKITILLLMLMVVFIGCGEEEVNREPENSCLYNDMYWGTSKKDIIAEKGEPEELTGAMVELDEKYNVIFYEEEFMNEDCRTSYYFDGNDK